MHDAAENRCERGQDSWIPLIAACAGRLRRQTPNQHVTIALLKRVAARISVACPLLPLRPSTTTTTSTIADDHYVFFILFVSVQPLMHLNALAHLIPAQ